MDKVLVGAGPVWVGGKEVQEPGHLVGVGDWVGFKSDHEQTGQIVEIRPAQYRGGPVELVLANEDGFSGDYLRYAKRTVVFAADCW